MRTLRLALMAGIMAVQSGCKDEPRYAASSESAAVDRAKMCAEGGATLNANNNECVCPESTSWTGIRCEAPAQPAGPALPEGLPPQGPELPAVPEATATPTPPAPAAADDFGARLKTACKRAHGTFLEKDQYCHCPNDKVLVARRCRTLNGNVTDDACLRSVNKGKWKRGVCGCERGLVFSPARGGCVPKFTGDVAVLRRICESSLNKGKWDAAGERCQCPAGRIWADELCQVQGTLSSRAVCESDANKGKWVLEQKRCDCPEGQFWIDQQCVKDKGVTAQQACESEVNRGRWDESRASCICPRLGKWDGQRRCK